MQSEHQVAGVHSPRNQVELQLELGHLSDTLEGGNPFSDYQEELHHHISSDEEGIHPGYRSPISSSENIPWPSQEEPTNGQKPIEMNQTKNTKEQEAKPDEKFANVEVQTNLSTKPPIRLLNSPKTSSKPSAIVNTPPPPPISVLKETDLDLSTFGKQPSKARPQPHTDRTYNKELQNDMQELKRKFMGKEQKKKPFWEPSKDEKPNLNKTMGGSRKMRDNIEFEEMRMLIKMGFQKKKTNYEMLREWDRRRAENMALHGKVIEQLQNEVDSRIKASLQNFQYYQTFFREKAKQEQKYATSPVINTRYALQNNSLAKNVYINCSVILHSLCDENANRCAKINDFVQLIRITILKDLTEEHLASSQRELLRVREKISTLKSALKRINAQTEERANQLASLFTQQANNITNTSEKDFYRTQLSFLRKAMQQIVVQRQLGQYCLEYYHTAVREEIKRSQVIRQAMVTYSKGLSNAYHIQPGLDCPQLQQMTKHQEIKLIQQFFNLEQIFDSRILQLLHNKTKLPPEHQLKIDTFTQYIDGFDYPAFDSRILLLKEFTVKYLTGKGKQTKEESVNLAITVDNFLHLFLTNQSKPDVTIKIGGKWLELRGGKEESLEVVKKEERRHSMMSYFWDSRTDKVYRFRFSKKDSRQEFVDYIGKLMVDQF